MNFGQTVVATMIGATSGFVFSLLLFYLKEWRAESKLKKAARRNLVRECEFNITLLEELDDALRKATDQVTADDTSVWISHSFARYQRTFVNQYYFQGILFEWLSSEDVTILDKHLIDFAVGAESYVVRNVQLWKDGHSDKATAVHALNFERDKLKEGMSTLTTMIQKINDSN